MAQQFHLQAFRQMKMGAYAYRKTYIQIFSETSFIVGETKKRHFKTSVVYSYKVVLLLNRKD